MKNLNKFLPWIAIGVLLVYIVISQRDKGVDMTPYETRITVLQDSITVIEDVNEDLENTLDLLEDDVETFTEEVERLNKKIRTIRRQRDEKIKHIDNLTSSELYRFFTERYR